MITFCFLSRGGNKKKACVWNDMILCQVLHTGTFSSIYHRVSLNSAAHCNLFSEQSTKGSCLSMEYSNKQLPLTGSGGDVRNVSPRTVFQLASSLSLWLSGSGGRRYKPRVTHKSSSGLIPPESRVWSWQGSQAGSSEFHCSLAREIKAV